MSTVRVTWLIFLHSASSSMSRLCSQWLLALAPCNSLLGGFFCWVFFIIPNRLCMRSLQFRGWGSSPYLKPISKTRLQSYVIYTAIHKRTWAWDVTGVLVRAINKSQTSVRSYYCVILMDSTWCCFHCPPVFSAAFPRAAPTDNRMHCHKPNPQLISV